GNITTRVIDQKTASRNTKKNAIAQLAQSRSTRRRQGTRDASAAMLSTSLKPYLSRLSYPTRTSHSLLAPCCHAGARDTPRLPLLPLAVRSAHGDRSDRIRGRRPG